eukprot:6184218-Pleurochrysis_carterae.AAC.3
MANSEASMIYGAVQSSDLQVQQTKPGTVGESIAVYRHTASCKYAPARASNGVMAAKGRRDAVAGRPRTAAGHRWQDLP